jgi:opacity protein-like surface antigen
MQTVRIVTLLAALSLPALAGAQRYDRDSTMEFGLSLVNSGSESVTGDLGTGLDIQSELGWGVWGAYNFNNHLAVTVDWTHVSPKYTATYLIDGVGLEMLRHQADIDHLHFKGTYNFLEGDMTPFVEVGLGWSWIDSNVATGPPSTGCWWDPWWGYICTPYYSTYNSRSTSFSYAVGFRWDISPNYTLRADYGIVDADASDFTGSVEVETIRLAFAWRF